MQQREVFNFVYKWSRYYIKGSGCKIRRNIKSCYILITGGAGVRKSQLIKTIHMSLSKVLIYKGGDPEKPRILLLAPTGVAAININETAVHSGLGINFGSKLYLFIDCQRPALSVLFSQFNGRLNKIFGYSGEEPFTGLPVIVHGDFYQLLPVKSSPIYSSATSIKGFLFLDFWTKF